MIYFISITYDVVEPNLALNRTSSEGMQSIKFPIRTPVSCWISDDTGQYQSIYIVKLVLSPVSILT